MRGKVNRCVAMHSFSRYMLRLNRIWRKFVHKTAVSYRSLLATALRQYHVPAVSAPYSEMLFNLRNWLCLYTANFKRKKNTHVWRPQVFMGIGAQTVRSLSQSGISQSVRWRPLIWALSAAQEGAFSRGVTSAEAGSAQGVTRNICCRMQHSRLKNIDASIKRRAGPTCSISLFRGSSGYSQHPTGLNHEGKHRLG